MGIKDRQWRDYPGGCVECNSIAPLDSSAVCEDCFNRSPISDYGVWMENVDRSRMYYEKPIKRETKKRRKEAKL